MLCNLLLLCNLTMSLHIRVYYFMIINIELGEVVRPIIYACDASSGGFMPYKFRFR